MKLLSVLRDINKTDIWFRRDVFIENAQVYSNFCSSLLQGGGYFSVVDRVSPFDGGYTSTGWSEQWAKIPCEIVQIADWLGTNVRYYMNSRECHGLTHLRIYRCEEGTRSLLYSRQSFAAWHPPTPDDFAAYTADGTIVCFVNRHEDELYVRKGFDFERMLVGC